MSALPERLAADPPVMLMDEPFGAVDPIVRERLQDQFLEIQTSLRKTIVFVTHDIDEAIKMADRIAILNVGGVLEQFASPEEILREPANEFVERFVGAERGLKRLALMKVSDIEIEEGPVVAPSRFGRGGSPADGEVRLRLGERGRRRRAPRLGGRSSSLGRELGCRSAGPARSAHTSPRTRTLRQALDSIVTSRTHVAVVASEGQRYAGILTLERISKEITS